MPQKQRMVFLLLSIGVLLTVGRLATGSFAFFLSDLWFTAGLLLLVLAAIVDQPHFSTDSNVFLNSTAGLLALASVPPAVRAGFWELFFAWTWYLLLTSFLLMSSRSRPLAHEPRIVQLVSRINRCIGRPEALFSAFFLWAVHLRFSPDSPAYAALIWFWAVFMIVDLPGVSRAISEWLAALRTRPLAIEGSLVAFLSPRIVDAELNVGAPSVALGRQVEIVSRSGNSCAVATIIDDRVLAGRRRVRMGITETTEYWQQLAANPADSAAVVFRGTSAAAASDVVSAVDSGSDIGMLQLRVPPDVDLNDGELLRTTLPNGIEAHYQVVSAKITRTVMDGDAGIHELSVGAGQLGSWDPLQARFSPVTWVAPPGQLVRKALGNPGAAVPAGCHRIGVVPRSSFPVHVNLQDVVTHNTAILGVTGSGKTYLAQGLVRALVQSNVRVLVLDITRQYWELLGDCNPQPIADPASLRAWLAGDSTLGVFQYATANSLTETTAQFAEAALTHLKGRVRLRAGVNEPANLCLVFEEAHSLIPEWNQVANKNETDHVNRTARTVLLGRKYGLGAIVISQRTANITKTILNQCNTIAALQCFDQTGLDFLRNYMGEEHAQGISTLPQRHAILVGKASSSARPIRVALDDINLQQA